MFFIVFESEINNARLPLAITDYNLLKNYFKY